MNGLCPYIKLQYIMKNRVNDINKISNIDYSGTSFLATFDTNPVTPGNPIVFNYPVHNTGGHYDPTTGIYTVPIDGAYDFTVHIWSYNDIDLGAFLTVDGDDVSKAAGLHYRIRIIAGEIYSRVKS